MKLRKAIVLNGLARGGTNIVWNILQSHPNIVSPIVETNQLLGIRSPYFPLDLPMRKLVESRYRPGFAVNHFISKFNRRKLNNLNDEYNKYKSPQHIYSRSEIEAATLCFKGVCSPRLWDLRYSNFLQQFFEEIKFIYLIRDGYSVCEGWMRRGYTPKRAGKVYTRYCREILEKFSSSTNALIFKFEDVLKDPFAASQKLYAFLDERPILLEQLRLKVKATVFEHSAKIPSGSRLHGKYWFSKESIGNILVNEIDSYQKANLNEENRRAFGNEAKEFLQYFNYL